jgi:hypothetical protein
LSAGAEPHFLRHLHGSDPFIPGIIKLWSNATYFQNVSEAIAHQVHHRPCLRWLGDEALVTLLKGISWQAKSFRYPIKRNHRASDRENMVANIVHIRKRPGKRFETTRSPKCSRRATRTAFAVYGQASLYRKNRSSWLSNNAFEKRGKFSSGIPRDHLVSHSEVAGVDTFFQSSGANYIKKKKKFLRTCP